MAWLIDQKQWLFLDLGSTLINEDVYLKKRDDVLFGLIREMDPEVVEDVYRERIKEIKLELPYSVSKEVLEIFVGDQKKRDELHREYKKLLKPIAIESRILYDDVKIILPRLEDRIHLGVIADQEARIITALDSIWKIQGFFDVMVISGVDSLYKPDAQMYQLALERASVKAGDAIMMGDRPDKDIAPANLLGMTTVRIRRGMDFCDSPARTGEETADFEVSDLQELLTLKV